MADQDSDEGIKRKLDPNAIETFAQALERARMDDLSLVLGKFGEVLNNLDALEVERFLVMQCMVLSVIQLLRELSEDENVEKSRVAACGVDAHDLLNSLGKLAGTVVPMNVRRRP